MAKFGPIAVNKSISLLIILEQFSIVRATGIVSVIFLFVPFDETSTAALNSELFFEATFQLNARMAKIATGSFDNICVRCFSMILNHYRGYI